MVCHQSTVVSFIKYLKSKLQQAFVNWDWLVLFSCKQKPCIKPYNKFKLTRTNCYRSQTMVVGVRSSEYLIRLCQVFHRKNREDLGDPIMAKALEG